MSEAPEAGRNPAWPYALLALLSIPVIFWGLGDYSVVNGDEAYYHYASRRMATTGEWTRLELTGEHRVYDTFMNAPLQYWVRGAVIKLCGDSYWTMRLPSALFALLSVLLTCRLGTKLWSWRAGLLAGLFQLTTFQFIYMHAARTGELEPVLAFVFTAIALTFLRGVEGKSFLPHHLCLIALVNLKLPLVAAPILGELLFFATDRRAWKRFLPYALTGTLIVPLGLAWHAYNFFSLDDQAREVFSKMGSQASGDERAVHGGLLHNAWFYLRSINFGAWPYALAYPLALVAGIATARTVEDRRRLRLTLVYPLGVFLFFCVVSKFYPWYIVPAYPFLSIWLGAWIARLWTTKRPAAGGLATAAAVLIAGVIWIRVTDYNPFQERALKSLLSELGPIIQLRDPVWGALLCVAFAFPLAWFACRRGGGRWVAGGLCALLFATGGWRVARPLKRIGHVSEMERLKADLDARRAAGNEIRYPIEIMEPGNLRVRYYFGDEYRIVKGKRAKNSPSFVLVGPGQTPANPPSFRTLEEHQRWTRELRGPGRERPGGGGRRKDP